MKSIVVQVQPDHIKRIANIKRPIHGIFELIWNSFDAEASLVEVYFTYNENGAIEAVHIRDNGHGIYYADAFEVFRKLGGSWKNGRRFSTNKHRFLHGSQGQGRFSAFGIGRQVSWHTHYTENSKFYHYRIDSNDNLMMTFDLSDPEEINAPHYGTEVTISQMHVQSDELNGEKNISRITEEFAIYLRQYPSLQLIYDGQLISASALEEEVSEYLISATANRPETKITIAEWTHNCGRQIFLCNTLGHTLEKLNSPLKLPGFNYTVHVQSELIAELEAENKLIIQDIQPSLSQLLDEIYSLLAYHFDKQSEGKRKVTIRCWQDEDIYPYSDVSNVTDNRQTRKLFDHYAVNIINHLPDFNQASHGHKQLTLTLISKLLESNPQILCDLLDEPSNWKS